MKKAIYTSLLAAIGLFSFWAFSGRPIYVAILDSPIDFHHTEISAILDEDLLQNVSIKDKNGEERSWYDLNEMARAEFEMRLEQGQYQEQVEFLDSINHPSNTKEKRGGAKEVLKTALAGVFKYITSAKFRTGLRLVGNYVHGTHVAGIMVRSLTNVRLISFPILTVSGRVKASDILSFDVESQRKEVRNLFDQISEVLKTNQVRVLNMSIATSEKIAFQSYAKRASFLGRVILRPWLKKLAYESSQAFNEEIDHLIQGNPQTVFVLAAGNEKLNLSESKGHTSHLSRPNLVKVAALNGKGAMAKFSNRSSEYVDIAALGAGVSSALINGGRIHLSGTSQAAPAVANAVAHIFEKNPNFTAEEAIQELFSDNTKSIDSLKDMVAQGRVLAKKVTKPKNKKTKSVIQVQIDLDLISKAEMSAILKEKTDELMSGKVSEVNLIFKVGGDVKAIQRLELDASGEVELTTIDPSVECPSFLEDQG